MSYSKRMVEILLCTMVAAVNSCVGKHKYPAQGFCSECEAFDKNNFEHSGMPLGWIRDAILEKAERDGFVIDFDNKAEDIAALPTFPVKRPFQVDIDWQLRQTVTVDAFDATEAEVLAEDNADVILAETGEPTFTVKDE